MKYDDDQQWRKTLLALFALIIVIALPIGIFTTATRQDTLKDEKIGQAQHEFISKNQEQENIINADFLALKTQMNDPQFNIAILEKSLNDFISVHGMDIKEVAELQKLLVARKSAHSRTEKIYAGLPIRAGEIKVLIEDPKKPIDYLESILSEYVAEFGEDRKETRELKRLLAIRKKAEEQSASQEKTIVENAKSIIGRINDSNEDLRSLQSAVSEFIIQYGEDRKEVSELRRVLDERKKIDQQLSSHDQEIVREAKTLAARINDKDEDTDAIESALSEFIIHYGDKRKEIPELRRLFTKRKNQELIEVTIAKEARELISLINDPSYVIPDLRQSINDFIDKYGDDREEVAKLHELLSERKGQENKEKEIAKVVTLLKNQISDGNYPIEEVNKVFYDFISEYGENRKEIPELKYHLEERKKAEFEEAISSEARDLMIRMADKTTTIDSLKADLNQFVDSYGNNRKEIPELTRVLGDRSSEEAITKTLAKLDLSVLEGRVKDIHSMVHDEDYAKKLVALTEWSGVIFRHEIRSFQRSKNESEIEVKIQHAVDHMPKRDLYYRYKMIDSDGDWIIEASERLDH